MRAWISCLTAAGAVLALAACGNRDAQPITQVAGAVVSQITSGAAAVDVRAQLTPEVLAAVQQPFLLADLPARQATATLALFATTGNRTDWRSGDGTAVVMDDDIIIATRGLGADLFLAEWGDLPAALRAGSGRITRRHTLLNGENRVEIQSFSCVISESGSETINLLTGNGVFSKLTETCVPDRPESGQFVNAYWISPDNGNIVQSKQWVSAGVGYIVLQYVKR